MSQIQRFGLAGIPPAGPLLTLTGDTGGAVSPTGGNINVLGQFENSVAQFAVVTGDPGSSELGIAAAFDRLTTVDEFPTSFLLTEFTLNPDQAIVMSAHVIGVKDDYSAACGGYTVGIARKDGVNPAVLVYTGNLGGEDSGAGNPDYAIDVFGDIVSVSVNGVAAETWKWTCTYQYTIQQVA
jgi:hypothetical protein